MKKIDDNHPNKIYIMLLIKNILLIILLITTSIFTSLIYFETSKINNKIGEITYALKAEVYEVRLNNATDGSYVYNKSIDKYVFKYIDGTMDFTNTIDHSLFVVDISADDNHFLIDGEESIKLGFDIINYPYGDVVTFTDTTHYHDINLNIKDDCFWFFTDNSDLYACSFILESE